MPRLSPLLLCGLLLVSTGSAPVVNAPETAESVLARARLEAAGAAKRQAELEAAADKASGEAGRLRAQRLAAVAAIETAEAQISESDAVLRLARAQAALSEQRLAKRRAPIAAMLAGLATMGRQPPLLALVDGTSVEEMVRVRALLDATMPVIERRSAALRDEVAERRRLEAEASRARLALVEDRAELDRRKLQFARLEAAAATRAGQLQNEAFGAGDRLLASSEALDTAGSEASAERAGRATASELARLGFAPARPMRSEGGLPPTDFHYQLPSDAPLIEGLGSVNSAGIASRGILLASGRGSEVLVPADGKLLFSGPFRSRDGVVIIDHGGGWTSLVLGVASPHRRGARLRRGEPLGRALGPIGVELRRDGRPISPAFIAASSPPLSNDGKNR